MRVVTLCIDLVIDDNLTTDNKDDIANYLTNMLYGDPDFFGEFGPENIVEVKEWEE